MTLRLALLTLSMLLPVGADAAVRISEVAWMGSERAATDEWIELFNGGSGDVDVTGWSLTSGTFEVVLAGTVGAGEYVILERTDESSAPGEAFLIYTGALRNAGDTLVLADHTGAVVDEVIGGSNWQRIGGSNETKHTAIRTDHGWVTGSPTPGSGTLAFVPVEPEPAPEAEPNTAFSFASEAAATATAKGKETKREATAVAAAPETPPNALWPYLGLLAVLTISIGGVVAGEVRNE